LPTGRERTGVASSAKIPVRNVCRFMDLNFLNLAKKLFIKQLNLFLIAAEN
jgi:hypothetical protein